MLLSNSRTCAEQAVNRGRATRAQTKAARVLGLEVEPKVESVVSELELAMARLYAACDETKLGVSVSELEEKLCSDAEARGLLDAPRGAGFAQLLHQLEIGRWLEAEGRISWIALMQIASGAAPVRAKAEDESLQRL